MTDTVDGPAGRLRNIAADAQALANWREAHPDQAPSACAIAQVHAIARDWLALWHEWIAPAIAQTQLMAETLQYTLDPPKPKPEAAQTHDGALPF